MQYWLVKSEPETWSWQDQVDAGTTEWDGVRNYQAAKNLKTMKKGDRALFYHSGKAREVVGIVEITREYYPDPTDKSERFGMVDVKTVKALPEPVTLKQIKAEDKLGHLALVRQPRLSVMPVDAEAWKRICAMGGLNKG